MNKYEPTLVKNMVPVSSKHSLSKSKSRDDLRGNGSNNATQKSVERKRIREEEKSLSLKKLKFDEEIIEIACGAIHTMVMTN